MKPQATICRAVSQVSFSPVARILLIETIIVKRGARSRSRSFSPVARILLIETLEFDGGEVGEGGRFSPVARILLIETLVRLRKVARTDRVFQSRCQDSAN